MTRFFPYPILSFAILVMWLLLTGSYAPRSFVFGALLGIIVPFSLTWLQAEKISLRNPRVMLRLILIVLKDIVRSNIAVTTISLRRGMTERISGFIHVPMDMQNVNGLAVLAIILTSTPGTLWIQYDTSTRILLLHVLDKKNEQEWIDLIKNSYESLLMEIFE